ncbi:MAG TPA: MgtC/SapB family protein [Mucilaginibacter sp.]|nr:MgtC/SapB family protein [Mucilaginibacter sp.]
MTLLQFVLRLALALSFGAIIGIERQWRQRMAGLRTNTLVSLGAALFISLAIRISGEAPSRVASYIVSGIGFLGAGVIMKDGSNVKGLNTAATLWCSAAVGSLAGMGLGAEALISTVFVVLVHLLLRPVGDRLGSLPLKKSELKQLGYVFIIKCRQEIENHTRVLLMQFIGGNDQLILRSLRSADNEDPASATISAEILTAGNQDLQMERIAGRLTIEQGVTEVSWKIIGQENDL